MDELAQLLGRQPTADERRRYERLRRTAAENGWNPMPDVWVRYTDGTWERTRNIADLARGGE